jgi:ABC-type glycerol-3-phosphate transport system permease component
MSARFRRSAMWRAAGILLALGLCLLPLLWTLFAALGLQPVGLTLRGTPTLDNFADVAVFEPAFGSEFVYTLAVTLAATLLTIGAAFPAAYRLARSASGRVDNLMQGTLVLALSPLIAYGLPLAGVERGLGLYGTFAGLVLASAAAQLPLALWLLRGYLLRIPRTLDEAAILDGASLFTLLWRVMLPVAAGGVIATAVLVFVLDWNLFLLPSLLTEHPPMVLPMAMRDFFAFERDLEWPTAAAALIVTLAPAFLLVFAAQRALEKLIFVPLELSN